MIRYITKKYLSPDHPDARTRERAGLLFSLLSILLNLLLCGAKCTAGALSGSIAVTADGINNLTDTGACLMIVLGLRLARCKPCRRYPFGYGRFEYLSGLFIGGVVLFTGGRLMVQSIGRIICPQPIDGKPVVLVMLALSILVKGYMYLYNKHIGALIDSAGMKAAAVDALSDCMATAAIMVGIVIERLTGLHTDGWIGAPVALCILWAGFTAAKDSLAPLLGRGPDEDTKARIECLVLRRRGIRRVHGIAVHDYGPHRKLLTLTVTLAEGGDPELSSLREEIRAATGMDAVIGTDAPQIAASGIKQAGTVNNKREET